MKIWRLISPSCINRFSSVIVKAPSSRGGVAEDGGVLTVKCSMPGTDVAKIADLLDVLQGRKGAPPDGEPATDFWDDFMTIADVAPTINDMKDYVYPVPFQMDFDLKMTLKPRGPPPKPKSKGKSGKRRPPKKQ